MTPFEAAAVQIDRDLRDGRHVDAHRIHALIALRNDATAHRLIAALLARCPADRC